MANMMPNTQYDDPLLGHPPGGSPTTTSPSLTPDTVETPTTALAIHPSLTSTLLTVPKCLGSMSHLYAKECQHPCPSSLQKALHPEFPHQMMWLASCKDEKHALQDVGTYETITLKEYCELHP